MILPVIRKKKTIINISWGKKLIRFFVETTAKYELHFQIKQHMFSAIGKLIINQNL